MNLNVIITGSTGMVGKGVLLECIESPDVSSILIINRSPIDISHPKVRELLHKDFFDWSTVRGQLSGYDACFFCMGVSSAGMKEEDYRHMTYDLTLGLARELLSANPGMTFCYVSGAGTDSSEKGRMMWARIKGKTENDLLALGFKAAYMFRPGFIRPMKGIRSRTPLYNAIYKVIRPFYGLMMKMPKFATDTVTVGKAMLGVTLKGYHKKILETLDINQFK